MEKVWLTCADPTGLNTWFFTFYLFSSLFLPGHGGFLFLEFWQGLEKRFRFRFHFDFDFDLRFSFFAWDGHTHSPFPFHFSLFLYPFIF